jgi:hypothetical protein
LKVAGLGAGEIERCIGAGCAALATVKISGRKTYFNFQTDSQAFLSLKTGKKTL